MKILQVSTVVNTLNAFLIPYAKSFSQEGWIVDAASRDCTTVKSVIVNHNECFNIDFSRNPFNLFAIFRSFYQIRRILFSGRYDVVHVHTPVAAFLVRLASVGLRETKIFYTAHGFHYVVGNPKWKNMIFYCLEKLAGYRTNHLFVINNDDFKFANESKIVPSCDISLINGIGVNISQYRNDENARKYYRKQFGINEKTFVISHVAELNRNKNHRVVIDALSLFKKNNPNSDFRYFVIGDGYMRKTLEKMVKELSLEKEVHFLGHRNDVNSILSSSDLLTLSSIREGLPRCILEAMCCSLPVIASNIRGCRDLLGSGAGVLVEHSNVEQWSQAIQMVYSQPYIRKRMSDVGHELVNELYEESVVVRSVLDIYKRLNTKC
ncbi:TPA: glycosyltransferase family 4 protein [Vibrio vulnificus]|nr:glycosyltransferase family 4 protein [Vibrio vulnificus]